ncbi:MAG: rod shape-determining protein [Rhizomicrobium sp.]
MDIKGRDLLNGVPKEITITQRHIGRGACGAGRAPSSRRSRSRWKRTPPELAADIVDKGIVLTGGGSLLANLDQVLREETGLPVSIADDPLSCVALGTGRVLENTKGMRHVSFYGVLTWTGARSRNDRSWRSAGGRLRGAAAGHSSPWRCSPHWPSPLS